jgi:hypothetical protein
VDDDELGRAVEKQAWHNIPEESKGEGKMWRKGESGGWREDLSPELAAVVEEITAPLLTQFYAKAQTSSQRPRTPRTSR